MADYVLEGPKWGSTGLGSSGGTVSWAIDGSVPAFFLSDLTAAFADWAVYANIKFQEVASTATANIDFTMGAIDGLDNTLGETSYYYSGSSFTSAAVEFDSGENWHVSGNQVISSDNVNLFVVALHEIGHAIGLDHYNTAPAVMNATLNPAVTDLQQSDIDGAQAIYGPNPSLEQAGSDHLFWRDTTTGDVVEWRFTNGQLTIADLGTVAITNQIADTHADYNADGRSDLLLRDPAAGTADVWDLSGSTTVDSSNFSGIPSSVHILSGHSDFNGDGHSDILWQSGSQLVDWTMSGSQVAGVQVIANMSATADIVDATGDYNGDGKSDLLVHDRDSGHTLNLEMNGANVTAVGDFGNIPTYLSIVDGNADLNGDGKSDILWQNHASGAVVEWLMNGPGVASTQVLYSVPNYLEIVDASGSYNGDGTSDILWRNTQSGEVVEWLMQNGQVSSVQSLGDVPTSFSIVDGHTDFTGDGTSDILWRDSASGRTVLWVMNQGHVAQTNDFGVIPTSLKMVDPGGSGTTITPDQPGTYYGTVGENTFYLNSNQSTFVGGAGENKFVFETSSSSNTIMDFKPNLDQFQFDHIAFTNLAPGNLSTSQFDANNSGVVSANSATADYIVENLSTGQLYLDHHVQNGADTQTQVALLQNHAVLSAHDFFIF
jgi:hypothetical protein